MDILLAKVQPYSRKFEQDHAPFPVKLADTSIDLITWEGRRGQLYSCHELDFFRVIDGQTVSLTDYNVTVDIGLSQ